MENPSIYIIAAIAIIVTVRQFSPLIAAGLGITLTITIGVWGVMLYDKGAAVGILSYKLPREIFLLMVGGWFAMEIFNLRQGLRRRRMKLDSDGAKAD